jgi:hypothetical protein
MKWLAVVIGSAIVLAGSVTAADTMVHLEIVQPARGSVDGAAQWVERLKRIRLASLRVRPSRPGDRPQIQQRDTGAEPAFHVTAMLSPRNELQVPGATFRLGDERRLSTWLDKLPSPGTRDETSGPLGLTPTVLAELKRDLSAPWNRSTAQWPLRSVVAQIQQRLPLSIVIDPTARGGMSKPPLAQDEYQGLAEGTVLAAVLRPAGLAFVPEPNERGSITLRIVAADAVKESWPVGWPNSRRSQDAVPKLFEFLPVEIADTPLSQTLAAIQPRLGVPLLIDRYNLAARGIDLDGVKVNHPAGRTFYKQLLDRVLSRARLAVTIREDDGGRPFLWVAPMATTR